MLLPVFPHRLLATSFIATGKALPLLILYSPTAVLLAPGYYNIPLATWYDQPWAGVTATEAAAQLTGNR